MFDTIAAVIDAKARPLTGDDDRPGGQRQAEALADVCGYVLDHGGGEVLPECGGHRVHVNVLIRLDDLENRARAACLDFGGPVSPEALRMLCTFTSSRRGPRLPARPGPGRTCCAPTRSR
jgi:5-methylcytosine-specific restriction protein A